MTAEERLINELAKEAGVTVRTIRYYMDQGLLPPPTPSGRYAHFSQQHLDRLRLIRKLKELHLPLEEIKRILDTTPPEEIEQLLSDQDDFSERTGRSATRFQVGDSVYPDFKLVPFAKDEDKPKTDNAQFADINKFEIFEPEEQALRSNPKGIIPNDALEEALPGGVGDEAAPDPAQIRSVRDSAPGKDALDYIARISSSQQRLRSPQPSRLSGTGPSSVPPTPPPPNQERWQRIPLAPGVELHVLESADPELKRMVEALIQEARWIFSTP